MEAARLGTRPAIGTWPLAGVIAGILAGILFIFFEFVVAWLMGDEESEGPILMISAIVLGEEALPMPHPEIEETIAIPIGFVVHFVLSTIFGAIFGAIVAFVRLLRTSRWALVGAATVFGFLLWIVNFYVIGSWAFPWFLMANQLWQGFVAHTFFYGTALGALLAAVWR